MRLHRVIELMLSLIYIITFLINMLKELTWVEGQQFSKWVRQVNTISSHGVSFCAIGAKRLSSSIFDVRAEISKPYRDTAGASHCM